MATTDSPQLAAPLATPEDISSFFAQNPNLPNIQSCTKLSGGYTNHTFRLAFEPASSASWEHQEQQIVAKSYITVSSFGAEFQLRLERAAIEYELIAHTPQTLHPRVAPPRGLRFITTPHPTVVLSTDAGADSTTLKALLLNTDLTPETAVTLGADLGAWLARFHSWGATQLQSPLAKTLENLEAQKNWTLWHQVTYSRLPATFSPAISAAAEASYTTTTTTFVHGDFWTGNILVDTKQKLTVVDWEMARFGGAWQDLGQMTAELWLCAVFAESEERKERAIQALHAFHRAYLEERGEVGREDRRLAVMHAGVHCAIWPQYAGWEPVALVEELKVRAGKAAEVAAEGDWEAIKGLGEEAFRVLLQEGTA